MKESYELLEGLLEHMTADNLLHQLIKAMGNSSAVDNLGYVKRVNDIKFNKGEQHD